MIKKKAPNPVQCVINSFSVCALRTCRDCRRSTWGGTCVPERRQPLLWWSCHSGRSVCHTDAGSPPCRCTRPSSGRSQIEPDHSYTLWGETQWQVSVLRNIAEVSSLKKTNTRSRFLVMFLLGNSLHFIFVCTLSSILHTFPHLFVVFICLQHTTASKSYLAPNSSEPIRSDENIIILSARKSFLVKQRKGNKTTDCKLPRTKTIKIIRDTTNTGTEVTNNHLLCIYKENALFVSEGQFFIVCPE